MPRHLKAALPLVALHFYPGRKKRMWHSSCSLLNCQRDLNFEIKDTHAAFFANVPTSLVRPSPGLEFFFPSVKGDFPLFIFSRHHFHATMANKRGCMLYIALNHCSSPCILVTNSNYGVNMLYLASHLWHRYGIPKRNWMAGFTRKFEMKIPHTKVMSFLALKPSQKWIT